MPQNERPSLWQCLSAAGSLASCSLSDTCTSVLLNDLVACSSLGPNPEELRGASVLIAATDQLTAALALIELDGIARRLVVCTPDLPIEYFPFLIANAAVDALVSDRPAPDICGPGVASFICRGARIEPSDSDRTPACATEWVLLTSGTTGPPKMVLHTLSTLIGAIRRNPGRPAVWSTFYDIRRYGGLQILLRALLDGGSLVLSSRRESVEDFLIRAGAHGVTHISGTPSHWRRALMSHCANRIAPKYVRLSGEIVDQSILNNLRVFYPEAKIVHAFASTEAGVAFEVSDGLAGFPTNVIANPDADVELTIEDGSLRIRSSRAAHRYLGNVGESLADEDRFVDTHDLVELRNDRYFFAGRRDGVINVGGLKVHPEEVEAAINRHPSVLMSLVKSRRNSITGAVVVADVVLRTERNPGYALSRNDPIKGDILEVCRRTLAPYKVPATIRIVPSLEITTAGKLARDNN
jgi:acyl-CoA synthetase (AMP-forming)/AMP-acid ligase II